MLVNVRGTSGSGKSHIVTTLRDMYDTCIPLYNNDRDDVVQYQGRFRLPKARKQPLMYLLERNNEPQAVLLGHYETACGGCDTIASLDTIFGLARERAEQGLDVIFEGLLVSAEHRRSDELFSVFPHLVLRLSTSMEVCVDGIQARRDARGDERPLNPKNTLLKDKAVSSTFKKLQAAGHDAIECDRDWALYRAKLALGFYSEEPKR